MDQETFENYKQDNQVIKFGEWQGSNFLHQATETIVFFAFIHKGLPYRRYGEPEKRIILDAFDFKNYEGPLPLPEIKSEQYILVNAHNPDFAMLFKININEQICTAKLTLEKYPKLGSELITDEEQKGVELTLQTTNQ